MELCARQLSVLRSVALYLLLVLIPQSLWLHSKRWTSSLTGSDTPCEGCSFLLPSTTAQSTFQNNNTYVNLTDLYNQLCQDVCTYKDVVLEGATLEDGIMEEVDLGEDGGWSVPHTLSDLAGPCTIPRRNIASLSQLEFLEKFSNSQPVVLEGVPSQTQFSRAATKWRLLAEYGQDLITVATANTHSYRKTSMTLCKYMTEYVRPQELGALGNETLYHFGDNDRVRWAPLFSLYQLPPYNLPGLEPVLSFGLAGPGSGVPFHIHGPTFAETIFGRKRWFLYPPEESPVFDPDESTLHWVTHTLPSLSVDQSPLQCTLSPGEVGWESTVLLFSGPCFTVEHSNPLVYNMSL